MFEVMLVSDILSIICRSEILSVMVVISFEISFCYDKTVILFHYYRSPEILYRILSRGLVDSEYNWPYYHAL